MELISLTRYSEASRSLQERKDKLTEEQSKLLRQLSYFSDSLERCQLVEDEEGTTKARLGLEIIHRKLDVVEQGLKELDLIPLAEAVFVEAEQQLAELKQQAEQQWELIIQARIDFLTELKQLGEIRRLTNNLCYSTSSPALQLRRNPLPAPVVSGQHQFVVSLDHVNSLIGA